MRTGKQQYILLAFAYRSDVLPKRFGVFGKLPLVDFHTNYIRPASFKSRNEGVIGDSVFLQSDGNVGDRDALIDQL